MKTSKKIILAAAGVLSAAAASAYITSKLLVETALDREQPKIMKLANKKISGSGGNTDFDDAWHKASAELRSKTHEKAEITAADGTKLTGHFFPCEGAKRIIIAFHGWRSSWHGDFGLISDFWHNNNCSVLYAEQRGQNGSGGEYMGFGLTERYDCLDWVNWAICRCGSSLPIYLAGISMGAATVLMSSDLNFPPNVHGIMADCGFTSPKEIWKHVAKNNLHIVYGLRSVFADMACRRKINMSSDGYSSEDALKKTNIPVLFVHGTDDKFVPVEMTYQNYKACNSPKRLLVVPGADHAMSYYIDRQSYENAVKSFWNDFDNYERQG